jgi:tRNA (cytidine32/guanosine34-2'-O)-methyltransferase
VSDTPCILTTRAWLILRLDILLAVNPFLLPPTSTGSIPLDSLPTPLVKLTDFGLSRFINLAEPALQTRCGSESFAAPEIIMGRSYDGRETDAWAMGVVLYALVAGELPFDGPEMGKSEKEERKRRMMRIAKGQYTWPEGVGSAAVREVVDRLLVRDPKKRMRVVESWDTEWFKGPGEISPPKEDTGDTGVEAGLKKRKVLDGFLLNEALGEEASAEL